MTTGDTITVADFSDEALMGLIGDSIAAKYVRDYLHELGVTALVVEPRYVDRHYLDDFANYYARSFQAPPPHCKRLHFFRGVTGAEVDSLTSAALVGQDEREAAQRRLQGGYLGFVVRRPLPGAPIGRSVLCTYPADGRRHFEVVRPYFVHVLGVRLKVEGLAYQQQDGGAAVCASTALWSALQRVAHVAGHRTPTPFAITESAKSPFPASHGLLEHHMAEAISSLGYSADRFVPAENRPLFRAKLVACLDSQLPVVLGIAKKIQTGAGETVVGHAVTVTGYAEPQSIGDVPTIFKDAAPLRMRAATVDTLYVHDDNLGFHAHYEVFDDDTEEDDQKNKVLKLRRGRTNKVNPDWWQPDIWNIESALVPKPDKVRLPLEDLVLNALQHRPLLEDLIFPGIPLSYRVRFDTGVEYIDSLVGASLDAADLTAFIRRTSLPRHMAVLTAYRESDAAEVLDVLMDATTVARDPELPNLLGFVGRGVPKQSVAGARAAQIATMLRVPAVLAPP